MPSWHSLLKSNFPWFKKNKQTKQLTRYNILMPVCFGVSSTVSFMLLLRHAARCSTSSSCSLGQSWPQMEAHLHNHFERQHNREFTHCSLFHGKKKTCCTIIDVHPPTHCSAVAWSLPTFCAISTGYRGKQKYRPLDIKKTLTQTYHGTVLPRESIFLYGNSLKKIFFSLFYKKYREWMNK